MHCQADTQRWETFPDTVPCRSMCAPGTQIHPVCSSLPPLGKLYCNGSGAMAWAQGPEPWALEWVGGLTGSLQPSRTSRQWHPHTLAYHHLPSPLCFYTDCAQVLVVLNFMCMRGRVQGQPPPGAAAARNECAVCLQTSLRSAYADTLFCLHVGYMDCMAAQVIYFFYTILGLVLFSKGFLSYPTCLSS